MAYRTAQSDKRILGRLAYLLRGVQALGEIRPVHVRAVTDSRVIEDDVILGLVASTTSVGGFKAKRDLEISLNDGLSEVVLVKDIKNILDLNAVASAILRQDFSSDYFTCCGPITLISILMKRFPGRWTANSAETCAARKCATISVRCGLWCRPIRAPTLPWTCSEAPVSGFAGKPPGHAARMSKPDGEMCGGFRLRTAPVCPGSVF